MIEAIDSVRNCFSASKSQLVFFSKLSRSTKKHRNVQSREASRTSWLTEITAVVSAVATMHQIKSDQLQACDDIFALLSLVPVYGREINGA